MAEQLESPFHACSQCCPQWSCQWGTATEAALPWRGKASWEGCEGLQVKVESKRSRQSRKEPGRGCQAEGIAHELVLMGGRHWSVQETEMGPETSWNGVRQEQKGVLGGVHPCVCRSSYRSIFVLTAQGGQ